MLPDDPFSRVLIVDRGIYAGPDEATEDQDRQHQGDDVRPSNVDLYRARAELTVPYVLHGGDASTGVLPHTIRRTSPASPPAAQGTANRHPEPVGDLQRRH